jgi:winged helix DNA-binding protein
MPPEILTERQLNRALLERQLLLRRSDLGVVDAMEHLVGMQAQSPNAPYLGLWSRLSDFTIAQLADAITDRRLVRISLMRGTIHLVSARDCRTLQPLLRPIFARAVANSPALPPPSEVDAVLTVADSLLVESPRTLAELRVLLGEHRQDLDPESMARAARYLLPLIHVPPKGIWGRGGQARLTTVQAWLGADVDDEPRLDDLLPRYLAAFGPASVKDMQTWCGLTGLREVVDRLSLRTFRDPSGTVLYDIPDGLLPDPDTPAPVRLLPEYDNCLRSHTDRRRVMSDANRALLFATKNDAPMPAFLIDGFVRGTWKLDRANKVATLIIRPFGALSKKDAVAVGAEARRLLEFAAPEVVERNVTFQP